MDCRVCRVLASDTDPLCTSDWGDIRPCWSPPMWQSYRRTDGWVIGHICMSHAENCTVFCFMTSGGGQNVPTFKTMAPSLLKYWKAVAGGGEKEVVFWNNHDCFIAINVVVVTSRPISHYFPLLTVIKKSTNCSNMKQLDIQLGTRLDPASARESCFSRSFVFVLVNVTCQK